MNFIAIDFETAASKRASACSVAVTVVRHNQIQNDFYSLINPEVPFFWRNVKVHGIHESDVSDAPTFPEIWPTLKPFFTADQLVVAHNNRFDNSVLRKTLERYGISVPRYLALDTLESSRSLLPGLVNYKLNTVSDYLAVDLKHHHNALADSRACAQILIEEQKRFGNDALRPLVTIEN